MLNTLRISTPKRPVMARTLAVLVATCLAASACGSSGDGSATAAFDGDSVVTDVDGLQYGDDIEEVLPESEAASALPDGFEALTWEDLIPAGSSGDEIIERYSKRLAELEDGSPEADVIYAEMRAEYDSIDVANDELDGAKVSLAGFVAPLRYEDELVTEFLLVPYFGACIHVPPPPSNQTVLVTVDKADGLTVEESWGAIWVAGTLTANSTVTDLATASYTMSNASSGVYDDY